MRFELESENDFWIAFWMILATLITIIAVIVAVAH